MEQTSKLEDIFTANIADTGEGGLLWKSVKVAETNNGPWGDIGSDQTESATADLDYGVSCLGAKSYKHQSRLESQLARNDRNVRIQCADGGGQRSQRIAQGALPS